jgi:hypothetical protein
MRYIIIMWNKNATSIGKFGDQRTEIGRQPMVNTINIITLEGFGITAWGFNPR